MTIWVDAQLFPSDRPWISMNYPVASFPLRELGLRDAEDEEIFAAARASIVIVLTKDSDFVRLLDQHGSPPKVLWLTCGNTSDVALQQILGRHLSTALSLLESGEDLVEIGAS